VSEVGDTITSGADIDSPASPLGPGFPGAPVIFNERNRISGPEATEI